MWTVYWFYGTHTTKAASDVNVMSKRHHHVKLQIGTSGSFFHNKNSMVSKKKNPLFVGLMISSYILASQIGVLDMGLDRNE